MYISHKMTNFITIKVLGLQRFKTKYDNTRLQVFPKIEIYENLSKYRKLEKRGVTGYMFYFNTDTNRYRRRMPNCRPLLVHAYMPFYFIFLARKG
ncbi:hypothetical protein Hanom_Chr03g00189841 [Helianthus anomalus]